jgi:hypothetical protein
MARAQTLKKEPWRKYKTNTSITVYNFLKIDGHTETPLVMTSIMVIVYWFLGNLNDPADNSEHSMPADLPGSNGLSALSCFTDAPSTVPFLLLSVLYQRPNQKEPKQ